MYLKSNMSDFTEVFASIKSQMEILLQEWKEENEDDEDLEEFFLFYTNHINSTIYYTISNEELNDSYREGSMWVLKKLNDDEECWGKAEILKIVEKMNEDNEYYARQLIYFIGTEL